MDHAGQDMALGERCVVVLTLQAIRSMSLIEAQECAWLDMDDWNEAIEAVSYTSIDPISSLATTWAEVT